LPGRRFGSGGIEIDHTGSSSPRGITVVAEIPNLIGRGGTAQMTYYETPAGAKVFAAGAFTLAGARDPLSRRLLQNVWQHLDRPGAGGVVRAPGAAGTVLAAPERADVIDERACLAACSLLVPPTSCCAVTSSRSG